MIRWPYEWRKKEGCPGVLPHMGGLQYRWDCLMENIYIRLERLPRWGLNQEERKEKVMVSLTTFPARIEQCYYAIKSLMLQDYRADQIVLWLSEAQFPEKMLPKRYKRLIQAGLTVRYCDDLRSHKKYYYALQEQKEDELVITFDDDIIYERDAISKLIRKHEQHPECIVCNRGLQITMDLGKVLPYREWKLCSEAGVKEPRYDIMPSTGAGCLYPYACMPSSTFDRALIEQTAWSADDIWVRFHSLDAGIKIVKTRKRIATLCNVYGSQKEALTTINNDRNENDRVIERLTDLLPNTVTHYLVNKGK